MTKEKKQKLQIVILQHGYAEEGTNWMNMFITPDLKESVQEMLEVLAKAIIDGMYPPEPYVFSACCKKAKEAEKIPAYCPDCGSRLQQRELELDDYKNIAWGYLNGVADGTHDAWKNLEEAGWVTFGSAIYQLGREDRYPKLHPFQNDPTFIYIAEYGVSLLAAAYMHILLPKDMRDKDYNYDLELETHVRIFGGDAKNIRIFKEKNTCHTIP